MPYYEDEWVTLHHGDCRELVPALGLTADCVIADPPYAETSLPWDRWPDGWPKVLAEAADSLWCFGSMRMFLDRRNAFADWKLSQDVVWQKQQGTGPVADRFVRVHELITHWYRGEWRNVYHVPPRAVRQGPDRSFSIATATDVDRVAHRGSIGARAGYVDDGTRILRSVIDVRNLRQAGSIHPTEKPVGILGPLIEYVCPPGGTVLDPFAGSGSTAVAARLSARRSVLIEADERYCEAIVRRLEQDVLQLDECEGAP